MQRIIPFIASGCLLMLAACSYDIARIARMQPSSIDTLRILNRTLEEYETKYRDYNGVILSCDEVLEFWAEDAKRYITTMRKVRYLVLNPFDQDLTTFEYQPEPGKWVNSIDVQILSPDGTVRNYTREDMAPSRYSSRSSYKLAYPDIKRGSIIEEIIITERRGWNGTSSGASARLQFRLPCEQLNMRYISPSWWKTSIKRLGTDSELPLRTSIDEEEEKIILDYNAVDVPAVADEPYSPVFRDMCDYFEFKLIEGSIGWYHLYPDLSWKDIAEEMYKDYILKDGHLFGAVKPVADEIVKGLNADTAKLEAIVAWVQDSIIHGRGRKDDDFAKLLDRRSGASYQICALARAMLESIGIQSDFLLIHSMHNGYFDPDYIDLKEIRTPAVSAVVGGRFYVVFPYEEHYPINLIPDQLEGQPALRMAGDGEFSIMDIPWQDVSNHTYREDHNVEVQGNGEIFLREVKYFSGKDAYDLRLRLLKMEEQEIEKLIHSFVTYTEDYVAVESYSIENLEDFKLPLQFAISYKIRNLVTITPEEIILQTGGLLSPASVRSTKVDVEKRRNPVRVYTDEKLVRNITIRYPKEWDLTTELKDLDYENMFGYVRVGYEQEERTLRVRQERLRRKASEPKEKIDELLDVSANSVHLHLPPLVFSRGRS